MLAWICANALSAAGPVPLATFDAPPPQSPQTQTTSSSSTSLTTQVSSSRSARSRELVDQTVTASGLLKDGGESGFHTFGVPYVACLDHKQLQQAIEMAREYLTSPTAALQEGAAVVQAKSLRTHLIALANIIPVLASAEGRAYSEKQQVNWQTIVGTLAAVLRSEDGQVHLTSKMASDLRRILANQLQALDLGMGNEGFFVSASADGTAAADLNTMLGYIVTVCAREHAERQEIQAELRQQRQQRQSHRRVTATKSERARVLGTADPGADMIGYVKRAYG